MNQEAKHSYIQPESEHRQQSARKRFEKINFSIQNSHQATQTPPEIVEPRAIKRVAMDYIEIDNDLDGFRSRFNRTYDYDGFLNVLNIVDKYVDLEKQQKSLFPYEILEMLLVVKSKNIDIFEIDEVMVEFERVIESVIRSNNEPFFNIAVFPFEIYSGQSYGFDINLYSEILDLHINFLDKNIEELFENDVNLDSGIRFLNNIVKSGIDSNSFNEFIKDTFRRKMNQVYNTDTNRFINLMTYWSENRPRFFEIFRAS